MKLLIFQIHNLDQNAILHQAEYEFVEKKENILITLSTGVSISISFLGKVVVYKTSIQRFKVNYFNTSKLFAKLKIVKADGSNLRELARIERQDFNKVDYFVFHVLDGTN